MSTLKEIKFSIPVKPTNCYDCNKPLWEKEYLFCKYCLTEPHEDEPINTNGSAFDKDFNRKWEEALKEKGIKPEKPAKNVRIPPVKNRVEVENVV